MLTKRIRSEYMKKFKDPKWETYSKCYEEMLKYRMTRRLLEHTHNPLFWSGSDSDSESGGRSPPPPTETLVHDAAGRVEPEAQLDQFEGPKMEDELPPVDIPRLPLLDEDHMSVLNGSQPVPEDRDEQSARQHTDGGLRLPESDPQRSRQLQSKLPKRPKHTRHPQRPRASGQEDRHPFALYGSGERDADISGRKTHNVGPAASTKQIHESALRAKTRRQVERQLQTQRAERRRAKSADKPRKPVQPEFNPWVTEYMRCFSARAR